MNSQVDTSPWHFGCCLAGAAVWKDKSMAEQKLQKHLSAIYTLPKLQDSPTIPNMMVGSKVQDRTDQ